MYVKTHFTDGNDHNGDVYCNNRNDSRLLSNKNVNKCFCLITAQTK